MKKLIFAAGAAALALGGASIASAATQPCPGGFVDHPVQAKQIKSALTQAFVSCNNPGGNVQNATTETGTVPTCYPAETYHQAAGSPNGGWTWGPKGAGTITFKAGKNKLVSDPSDPNDPYPQNTDPTAVDLYIQIKVGDVRDNNGLANSAFPGAVQSVARATFVDRQTNNAPMTVIDFPTGFPIDAVNGKISKKTSASAILDGLNQPALPRCANIELISVLVKDPNGNTFANLGTFLP